MFSSSLFSDSDSESGCTTIEGRDLLQGYISGDKDTLLMCAYAALFGNEREVIEGDGSRSPSFNFLFE